MSTPFNDNNTSFSKQLLTLQLAHDTVTIGAIKDCLRKYELSIIHGYSLPTHNADLTFGLHSHSAFELYDHKRAEGQSHVDAQRAAVKLALTLTWDNETNQPWNSGNKLKNRDTLIRTIVDYLDHFENDPVRTIRLADGTAAVELHFTLELDIISRVTGERFILCGNIDRLGSFQERIWVTDRKTTKNTINNAYFKRYSPDNQVSHYSYSGKLVYAQDISGVIIDAMQIKQDTTEFQRGIIERRESTLNEWIQDTQYYLALAELAAERNYWPQNDKACGRVYEDPDTGELHYGCIFRPVCGAAPEIRQTLLDLEYIKRDRPWNPLQPREKPKLEENATEKEAA